MTYKQLHEKIASGEIVLPVEVEIIEPCWDEFELDSGCKAKLVKIQKYSDGLSFYFDFNDYVEYNKNHWEHNFYDSKGNPSLAIYETHWWNKLNGKCDCLVEDSDLITFKII